MNGAPEIDSFENSLPEGSENWPLWKKEAQRDGEPAPDSQGGELLSDPQEQKLSKADMFDIPGEPIKYPTIEPEVSVKEEQVSKPEAPATAPDTYTNFYSQPQEQKPEEPKPPAETLTAHPETLASSLKREANEWYGKQDDSTKRMIFRAFTEGDIENLGEGPKERKEELVRKSVGSIPPGSSADILTNLTGEKVPEPEAAKEETSTENANADFSQNRMPPRRGFDPSMTQILPSVSVPESSKPLEKVEVFRDPSVLIHQVREGDSLWSILENALQQ